MNITRQLLKVSFPSASDQTIEKFIEPIATTLKKFSISSKHDISAFLAHIGHESGDLKFVKENLNYSSQALQRVFKKYFPTQDLANQYARKPEMIANRVYANRMGNGPESSGDGWKFRGRGVIQLTGKSNYQEFAKAISKSLDDTIQYLETPEGACMSAGFFWSTRDLNGKTIEQSTRIINGGFHGLDDRKKRFEAIIKVI